MAAKILAERGIPFEGFELGSDIGGIWRYRNDSGRSPAYRSLETNTSAARTAYRCFPLDGPPRYLEHGELLAYFEAFADRFDVRDRFRFRHEVVRVEEADGGYRVTARSLEDGREREAVCADVLVAAGHHWDAHLPDWVEAFTGPVFHSRAYRTPDDPEPLAGRRVLVVGIGNSACDIACDVADVAGRVVLSTRRGAHVLPKKLFGRPIDLWVTPLTSRLPVSLQARLLDGLVRLDRGDQRRYGLPRPPYPLGHEHPTLSQDLPGLVRSGAIAVAPDVEGVEGRRIRFADGWADSFDVVICATGYHIAFPFLASAILDRIDPAGRGPNRENGRIAGNRIRLYRHVVPPDVRGLYFLGLVQPLGAIPPLAEAQAEWIADLLEGTSALPSPGDMWASIEATERRVRERFVESRRHTLEVDVFPYTRTLARERRTGRARARKDR